MSLIHPTLRIEQLFISPGHNYFGRHGQAAGTHPLLAVEAIECVAGRGIVGDRFFDFKIGYKGQVTFFSSEIFEEVARTLGVLGKKPGVTRRNAITRGVELNSLIGARFQVQGVEFEGMAECKPCYWMDEAIAPGAEALLQGRGGLRARILTSGTLRVGL